MFLSYGVPLLVSLVFGLIADYFLLPAWSLFNPSIYFLLIILSAVFALLHFRFEDPPKNPKSGPKLSHIILLAIGAILVGTLLLGWIFSWPVFHAKVYAGLIGSRIVEDAVTNLDISVESVSILDDEAANLIAAERVSASTDLSTKYNIRPGTQINYCGIPTQAIPLDYPSALKGLLSGREGVSAYLTVNLQNQDVNVCSLVEPMRYTPKSVLGKDLMRHIHYAYPSAILSGEPRFELDDTGKPFYIVSVVKPQILLFGGKDVTGIIVVEPCTGDSSYYNVEDAPEWVDNIYPAEMIVSQYDTFGKLRGGFLSSLLNKKDSLLTTEGYRCVCDGQDAYVFTCITSGSAAEPCIGFLYSNLRTKETLYYAVAGADEDTAISAAEQTSSTAFSPVALMVEGTPTYCMALKGEGSAAESYAMVNAGKPHLVSSGLTLEECQSNYRNLILSNDITVSSTLPPGQSEVSTDSVSGRILDIRSAEKEGSTYFYLRLEGIETWYIISLTDNEEAIKLNTTDAVVLKVESTDVTKPMLPAKLISYTEGAPWWDS